jgi:predicted ribosomally synthesized peptide with SipW-like signal peptide
MSDSERNRTLPIVAALLAIAVASAALGAGTFALFSDTETESGTLDAGTLQLDVGEAQNLNFTATDIKPTDSNSNHTDLSPSGSVTGNLTVSVQSLNTVAGEDGDADLQDHLEFRIWLDEGASDDGSYDNEDIGLQSDGTTGSPSFATVSSYESTEWTDAITGMDNDWSLHVEWEFPSSSNDNDAQGDEVTTTFEFVLEQQ